MAPLVSWDKIYCSINQNSVENETQHTQVELEASALRFAIHLCHPKKIRNQESVFKLRVQDTKI